MKTRILEKHDSVGSYYVPQVEQCFGLLWWNTHHDSARFRTLDLAKAMLETWLKSNYPRVVEEADWPHK